MRVQDKVSKGLELVLREMCNRVGCDYDIFDFDRPDWFHSYEWTEREQEDFKKWLEKNIINNKEIRKSLIDFYGRPSKRLAEAIASDFVFQYGWKLKKEDVE